MSEFPSNEPSNEERLQARIVAWVLGEASAFEAEELEGLCKADSELRAFADEVREIHGLLGEAAATAADPAWRLSDEKRQALEPILGGDAEIERRVAFSRRRAITMIAACVVVTAVAVFLMGPGAFDPTAAERASVGTSELPSLEAGARLQVESEAPEPPAAAGEAVDLADLRRQVRDQEEKVEERRKVLTTIGRTRGITATDNHFYHSGADGRNPRADLESFNKLEQEKMQLESQIASLEKYNSDQLMTFAAGLDLPDSTVKSLHPQFLEKKRELEGLKVQGMGESHPTVQAQQEMLDQMKRDLDEGVTNLRATLKAQRDLAADRLAKVKVMKDEKREEAIGRGLDAHDYADAKRELEKDQVRLQELKVKLIGEEMTGRMSEPASRNSSMPKVTAASPAAPAAVALPEALVTDADGLALSRAREVFGNDGVAAGPSPDLQSGRAVYRFSAPGQAAAEPQLQEAQLEFFSRALPLDDALTPQGQGAQVDAARELAVPAEEEANGDDLYLLAGAEIRLKSGSDMFSQARGRVDAYVGGDDMIRMFDATVAGDDPKDVVLVPADPRPQSLGASEHRLYSLPAEVVESHAAEEPVSTFSLNVGDASFRIARAAIAKGGRPEPAEVKVEQFYNAMDYMDPAPASGEPVAARIEQAADPVLPGRQLLRVGLRTASDGRAASQPLRLTLLVDQSGSMGRDDRREALAAAIGELVTLLTPADRVTVIGFARTPHLLAEGMSGADAAKLPDVVTGTATDGGTNFEEALKLARELALRQRLEGAQNRIILFTDGAANLGDADPGSLSGQITELRQQGLAFDIAGMGTDELNDRLLGEMARHGNGRYLVVNSKEKGDFARRVAGAFRPAAENVKVQVKFNPARVGAYRLVGFEADRLREEDFHNDAVDAAELAADESGVALYQIETLPEGEGEIGEVSVRFRDTASGGMVERSWTLAYDPASPAFDRASPALQMAGLAMMAGERLRGGALAEAIDFSEFSRSKAEMRRVFGGTPRVVELLEMIEAID